MTVIKRVKNISLKCYSIFQSDKKRRHKIHMEIQGTLCWSCSGFLRGSCWSRESLVYAWSGFQSWEFKLVFFQWSTFPCIFRVFLLLLIANEPNGLKFEGKSQMASVFCWMISTIRAFVPWNQNFDMWVYWSIINCYICSRVTMS